MPSHLKNFCVFSSDKKDHKKKEARRLKRSTYISFSYIDYAEPLYVTLKKEGHKPMNIRTDVMRGDVGSTNL